MQKWLSAVQAVTRADAGTLSQALAVVPPPPPVPPVADVPPRPPVPLVPALPEVPEAPVVPALPVTPALPVVPAAPPAPADPPAVPPVFGDELEQASAPAANTNARTGVNALRMGPPWAPFTVRRAAGANIIQ